MKLNPFQIYHEKFRNPNTRIWVIVGTLLYLFSPIDIIPDFLLGIGFVDDLVLLIMFLVELAYSVIFPDKEINSKNSKQNIIDAKEVKNK